MLMKDAFLVREAARHPLAFLVGKPNLVTRDSVAGTGERGRQRRLHVLRRARPRGR
jgi:hypothetical protein